MFHARTKHIEINFHFVRDKVASKNLVVRFISTKDQKADIFTKPLVSAHFARLRDNLNIMEILLQLRGHIKTIADILEDTRPSADIQQTTTHTSVNLDFNAPAHEKNYTRKDPSHEGMEICKEGNRCKNQASTKESKSTRKLVISHKE
jgi:hypothetical protein